MVSWQDIVLGSRPLYRRNIIGVSQSQRVSDLVVHDTGESVAVETIRIVKNRSVQDCERGTRQPRHGSRPQGVIDRAHIALTDHQLITKELCLRRLNEFVTRHLRVDLKDLADDLLFRLRDQVLIWNVGGIDPKVIWEVVPNHSSRSRQGRRRSGQTGVLLTLDLTVTGFIFAARSRRQRNRLPADIAGQSNRRLSDGPQTGRRAECRVVVVA